MVSNKTHSKNQLSKLKKVVEATIADIKNKLQTKGVEVTSYKASFDGEICLITIRTPNGTRFKRFGLGPLLWQDEFSILAKKYLVNEFIASLEKLNLKSDKKTKPGEI